MIQSQTLRNLAEINPLNTIATTQESAQVISEQEATQELKPLSEKHIAKKVRLAILNFGPVDCMRAWSSISRLEKILQYIY